MSARYWLINDRTHTAMVPSAHLSSPVTLSLLFASGFWLLEEQQVHGREHARFAALDEAKRHLDEHFMHIMHAVRRDVQR